MNDALPRKSFRKDVKRDAFIVMMALHDGSPVAVGMEFDMSPDELLVYHPRWLARQNKAYRDEVVAAVMKLEIA